jgi:hypothetical protein
LAKDRKGITESCEDVLDRVVVALFEEKDGFLVFGSKATIAGGYECPFLGDTYRSVR